MPTWCSGGSQLAVLPSSRFWLPRGNRTRKVDTMARIAMLPQIRGKKGIIEMIRRSFLVPIEVKSPIWIDLLLSGYKFQGV